MGDLSKTISNGRSYRVEFFGRLSMNELARLERKNLPQSNQISQQNPTYNNRETFNELYDEVLQPVLDSNSNSYDQNFMSDSDEEEMSFFSESPLSDVKLEEDYRDLREKYEKSKALVERHDEDVRKMQENMNEMVNQINEKLEKQLQASKEVMRQLNGALKSVDKYKHELTRKRKTSDSILPRSVAKNAQKKIEDDKYVKTKMSVGRARARNRKSKILLPKRKFQFYNEDGTSFEIELGDI